MVSEKLKSIWKRKADAGEGWAIAKLKALKIPDKTSNEIPKNETNIEQSNILTRRKLIHDRRMSFKLSDKLYYDFEMYRKTMGYNIKTGRSKCVRALLEEILATKIRLIGYVPMSYATPLEFEKNKTKQGGEN
jgi:hypothetical protein